MAIRIYVDNMTIPKIEEVLIKGDKYYGISWIRIISDEKQSEIRINLFPIAFEISLMNRHHIRLGVRLYKFLIGLEFDYESI